MCPFKALSKKMHVPYYVIPVTAKQNRSKHAVPFEVGPREFVSLFKNAKYVFTDSFHGTAFSVNFNVPFSVFKRFKDSDKNNQNSRIYSLLTQLGLADRLVKDIDKCAQHESTECDFGAANAALHNLRKASRAYLEEALARAVDSDADETTKNFKITDLCCGCGACAAVCKKGAVTIQKNDAGFFHYTIDETRCVQCKQCKAVCPMTDVVATDMHESFALFAAKSNEKQVLRRSSSGGVAHALASALLKKGYAVCGCAYDTNEHIARHIWLMPEHEEKLSALQGSKYIQSHSATALSQLVNMAKNAPVLFFGTPCQAAAADKLLRVHGLREQAVIVDLICHGVPSYHLWEKFLHDIDKMHGTGSTPTVLFRDKAKSWHQRMLTLSGNGRRYQRQEQKDDFYAFFRRGLCNMPSCADCPYRERSSADIRLGDYWGERFLKDTKGVSMAIANTACGQTLLTQLADDASCVVNTYPLSEYWSVQYPYNLQKPLLWDAVILDLQNENIPLHKLRKKYCGYYDKVERLSRLLNGILRIVKRR